LWLPREVWESHKVNREECGSNKGILSGQTPARKRER
jgi:hypothetical protein